MPGQLVPKWDGFQVGWIDCPVRWVRSQMVTNSNDADADDDEDVGVGNNVGESLS